jgi:hypothetical protein
VSLTAKAGLFLAGKWLLTDPIGRVKEEQTLETTNKHYDTKLHLQFKI